MSPPLVSFVLLAYNQEKYIREAVEGAFSQTYSPLEIILSDDCSSDRTYEVMEDMALHYDGPHKVILNRNPKNFGIGAHVNRVNELGSGQLIIAAAGDDISADQRVQRLVSKWMQDPIKIHLLYSDCEKISNNGEFLSLEGTYKDLDLIKSFIENDEVMLGAVCAWSRVCVERFGPLLDCIHHEDAVFPFRAAVLGEIAYVPEALVKYRVLAGSTVQGLGRKLSFSRIWYLKQDLKININHVARQLRATSDTIAQKKIDLQKRGSSHDMIVILDERARDVEIQMYLISTHSLFHKIRNLLERRCGKLALAKLIVKVEIARLLNIFPTNTSYFE